MIYFPLISQKPAEKTTVYRKVARGNNQYEQGATAPRQKHIHTR